jgi:thioredoxin 1
VVVGSVVQVTDATFEREVLQAGTPVLIDFWAPWCGPCKMIAPVMDELAREYDGRLKVVKVNTDENPATAGRYGVRAMPNLLLLKNGLVADQLLGSVAKAKLVKAISAVV